MRLLDKYYIKKYYKVMDEMSELNVKLSEMFELSHSFKEYFDSVILMYSIYNKLDVLQKKCGKIQVESKENLDKQVFEQLNKKYRQLLERDRSKFNKKNNDKVDVESDIKSCFGYGYDEVLQKIIDNNPNSVSSKKNVKHMDNNTIINKEYLIPSIDLLNKPNNEKHTNEEEIKNIISKIEKVFDDFKITAKVCEVHIGQLITQYELEVKAKTYLKKAVTLNKEIEIALSENDVKIEMLDEDKKKIGVNIHNKVNIPISLRELIVSTPKEKLDNKLFVPLGKDKMGIPMFFEINKGYSLLINGNEDSGPKNLLNTIICSILMRARPNEVNLLLVDPNKVYFNSYEGLPHLALPVVYEPREFEIAISALYNMVQKRLDLFNKLLVKNIEEYNLSIEKNGNKDGQKIPHLIVVINEFDDLLYYINKETINLLTRVIQLSKITGIHVIISYETKNSKLIDSKINNSIYSKATFKLTNSSDSKYVIGSIGAENLPYNNMLFLPGNENNPIQIQCPEIFDEEISRLVYFWCTQKRNLVSKTDDTSDSNKKDDENEDDPLYNEALEYVVSTGKASASLLQRRFKLGYNRAARLIDLMEESGIVGPQQGSKPREVLYKVEKND